MVARSDIIREARSWIGTPFHKQARVKGTGVDCVGLLFGICESLGIPAKDRWEFRSYRTYPAGKTFLRWFDAQCSRTSHPAPGDILTFWVDEKTKKPRHSGVIVSPTRFVHAHFRLKKVIEESLDFWGRAIVQAYRFPGVK